MFNVSFLPPFAAATLLNFTQWWHKLGRRVYSRLILISGSIIPKLLYIQSRWDMALLVYKKQAHESWFNILWVNLVDANFLSSTIFIHKQNYQLPGIHKANWWKTIGLFTCYVIIPCLIPNFAVITFNTILTTTPSYCCGSQSLDDKRLSHYLKWRRLNCIFGVLIPQRHQHE